MIPCQLYMYYNAPKFEHTWQSRCPSPALTASASVSPATSKSAQEKSVQQRSLLLKNKKTWHNDKLRQSPVLRCLILTLLTAGSVPKGSGSYEGTDAALSSGADHPGLQYLHAYLRGRAAAAVQDLRASTPAICCAQRRTVCHSVRQSGRAGGHLQKGAGARTLAAGGADDVPDAGHPAGRAGGGAAGLA